MLILQRSLYNIILFLWTLAASLTYANSVQKFLETPSPAEVSPEKDVLLRCKVQNRRGTCSWQKDNKPVGTYSGKYEWSGGAVGGTAGGEDCSLWVRAASLQLDDGLWQCQVTASSYDAQDALSSPAIPLSVRVAPQPPRLLQSGSTLAAGRPLSAAQGARTSILCESRYGNPPASITWFLDDEQLSAWSQTNSSEVERPRVWAARSAVEIVGSRAAHGRRLSCRASHAAYPEPGYKDASAILDVTFPPIASISGADGLDSLEEGAGALALRCLAEGNPPPNAWWSRAAPRSLPINSQSQDALLLAPLARNHSGTYTCQAKNSMGESDPVSIDIDVKYPARVMWVGPEPAVQASLFSRVVLECRAEGNPPPRYLWTHSPLEALDPENGMPIGRDSALVLQNVSYRQQGTYRCTSSNTISGRERWHASDPVTLAVVGPPVGEGGDAGGASEARLGADARVSALVCAEPPPRKAAWHWGSLTLTVPAQIGRYRSAEAVRRGACYLYVLHVTATTRQDARTYLLRVENERGATAHAAHLVLHENAALGPLAGAAVVAVIIFLAIFCIIRRCRNSKEQRSSSLHPLHVSQSHLLAQHSTATDIPHLDSKSQMAGSAPLIMELATAPKCRNIKIQNLVENQQQPVKFGKKNEYSASELNGDKAEGLPADAVYSTTRVYSPDALKSDVDTERDHVYSILEPRVQYDVTISRMGTPPTHLTVSRPMGGAQSIPPPPSNPPPPLSRRSRRSGKSSARPKSLQSYGSPQYLDHLFPSTAEL